MSQLHTTSSLNDSNQDSDTSVHLSRSSCRASNQMVRRWLLSCPPLPRICSPSDNSADIDERAAPTEATVHDDSSAVGRDVLVRNHRSSRLPGRRSAAKASTGKSENEIGPDDLPGNDAV